MVRDQRKPRWRIIDFGALPHLLSTPEVHETVRRASLKSDALASRGLWRDSRSRNSPNGDLQHRRTRFDTCYRLGSRWRAGMRTHPGHSSMRVKNQGKI